MTMAHYFNNLNYTLGDEDPTPEMHLLSYGLAHVMAVADCGSRIIPLLAKQPRKLTCVDINPCQLAVCELRLALVRNCTLDQYKLFLGYQKGMVSEDRRALFQSLIISINAKKILEEMFENVGWENMLYLGKFERMLKLISKINRIVTGSAGIEIFKFDNLEEQTNYYKRHFPRQRWKFLVALLGNSTALNSLLYKGAFPKKNRSDSHYSIYSTIFDNLFTEQLAKKSFFLQMLFFGEIIYLDGLPVECNNQIYMEAKRSMQTCDVSFINSDIFEVARHADKINFISLSDVPSFLPHTEEREFLSRIKPGLARGALAVVRAHLRLPSPRIGGFIDTSDMNLKLAEQESSRLWTLHTYQRQF